MLIGLSDLEVFLLNMHSGQLNGQPPVSYFIDFDFLPPIIQFNGVQPTG